MERFATAFHWARTGASAGRAPVWPGRFAVKEAVGSFGHGHRRRGLKDIEVLNDDRGCP
jgi:phosphopantetheinyl transferase (holo-ACP synthase)